MKENSVQSLAQIMSELNQVQTQVELNQNRTQRPVPKLHATMHEVSKAANFMPLCTRTEPHFLLAT